MASVWTWESEHKDMKKDLQKVVKMFREGTGNFAPKAMMTHQQELKGTATINCGFGDPSIELAEAIKAFTPFVEWCKAYEIKTVVVERVKYYNNFQGQIRVTY